MFWPPLKSLDFYFDYQLAVDELKFFDSGSIPKIENIPTEISNVKFSCDLSNIKSLSKNELKKIDSVLFRGLLWKLKKYALKNFLICF